MCAHKCVWLCAYMCVCWGGGVKWDGLVKERGEFEHHHVVLQIIVGDLKCDLKKHVIIYYHQVYVLV